MDLSTFGLMGCSMGTKSTKKNMPSKCVLGHSISHFRQTLGSWCPPLPTHQEAVGAPSPYWVALSSLKEVYQWAFWEHCGLWMLVHCLNLMKIFLFFSFWMGIFFSSQNWLKLHFLFIFYPHLGVGWVFQTQMWINLHFFFEPFMNMTCMTIDK